MSQELHPPEDLEVQVLRVARTLKTQGRTAAPDEVIERTVRDCFAERQDAKIKDFVVLLAERSARERLRRWSDERHPTRDTG